MFLIWSYEGRKVGHLPQIQSKSQFLFHKNLPSRDFSIMTLGVTNWDIFLFRKLWLCGSFKPRHVTNGNMFLLPTLQYILISIPFLIDDPINHEHSLKCMKVRMQLQKGFFKHCIVGRQKKFQDSLDWIELQV